MTVNTFYPKLDGVQAVTDYLTTGLAKKGHQITVITTMSPGLPKEEFYKGIKIIRVNVYTKYALYHGDKVAYRKLILSLSKKHDVMINVCTQQALTDLLFPILNQIHCKKVLHIHGINDFKWSKSDFMDWKHFFYKIWKIFRWWKLYKFNGKAIKKYDAVLQLHRLDPGYMFFKKTYGIQSYILENACDYRFGELSNINKEKYCICVANYDSQKNHEFVLKAFYNANISKEWKMIFIGSRETNYYKYLIKESKILAQKYGERKVEFLTGVTRNKTIDLVKKASVYLFGSNAEKFSVSIVEAMAANVPFISTDVGVTKYLPGGIIVDTIEMMSYWLEIFTNHPLIAEHYGNSGHIYYLQHLTTQGKVDELNEILESINSSN